MTSTDSTATVESLNATINNAQRTLALTIADRAWGMDGTLDQAVRLTARYIDEQRATLAGLLALAEHIRDNSQDVMERATANTFVRVLVDAGKNPEAAARSKAIDSADPMTSDVIHAAASKVTQSISRVHRSSDATGTMFDLYTEDFGAEVLILRTYVDHRTAIIYAVPDWVSGPQQMVKAIADAETSGQSRLPIIGTLGVNTPIPITDPFAAPDDKMRVKP